MSQPVDIGHRLIKLGKLSAPIPERLLMAHARGEALFIAGAGVSIPAGLPSFRQLVLKVYETCDPGVHRIISRSCERERKQYHLNEAQRAEIRRFQDEEYDVVLGMLERRLEQGSVGEPVGENRVRKEIAAVLGARAQSYRLHRALLQLADRGEATAIVTTNFDLLFEDAARAMGQSVHTYALGGIPRPTRRPEFSGVLHLHGALERNPDRTSNLIITEQDFGEYYFRRRVVPDLIYDAARLYNLVFVGYSASDPPMRYLLNAVAADVTHFPDLKERFIFVSAEKDDPVALEDWRARGITPIRYDSVGKDHSQLKHTVVQWARFTSVQRRMNPIDRAMKDVVKTSRSGAGDEQRDLFDHIIHRSDPQERRRLSALVASHGADLGWLDAIVDLSLNEW